MELHSPQNLSLSNREAFIILEKEIFDNSHTPQRSFKRPTVNIFRSIFSGKPFSKMSTVSDSSSTRERAFAKFRSTSYFSRWWDILRYSGNNENIYVITADRCIKIIIHFTIFNGQPSASTSRRIDSVVIVKDQVITRILAQKKIHILSQMVLRKSNCKIHRMVKHYKPRSLSVNIVSRALHFRIRKVLPKTGRELYYNQWGFIADHFWISGLILSFAWNTFSSSLAPVLWKQMLRNFGRKPIEVWFNCSVAFKIRKKKPGVSSSVIMISYGFSIAIIMVCSNWYRMCPVLEVSDQKMAKGKLGLNNTGVIGFFLQGISFECSYHQCSLSQGVWRASRVRSRISNGQSTAGLPCAAFRNVC